MLTDTQRQRFDDVLDRVVGDLPSELRVLLDEVPLIVEDEPARSLIRELDIDPQTTELCGLHSGVPLTHRSVQHSYRLPDQMMLFRGPILRLAGRRRLLLVRQVRITLLHEMGHHFGLDEDDLARLGYG